MKKIYILISVIIFGALAYFGYSIVRNRHFNDKGQVSKITGEAKSEENETEPSKENSEESPGEEESAPESNSIKTEIKQSDCENGCKSYEKNDDEFEYCQQICGLDTYYDYEDEEDSEDGAEESDTEEDTNEDQSEEESAGLDDCKEEKGLQKDYCLKDNAIDDSDYSICEQISDTQVKKVCKNRIAEDIIENQQ